MEFSDIAQSLLALMFVAGLILLCSFLLRKYGTEKLTMATRKPQHEKRLSVVEATMLDGRRKLVLIKRDNTEHLLLLSPTHETVIETGIIRPASPPHSHDDIHANTWKVQ
jgi:flagellar protein FliO/FliZ